MKKLIVLSVFALIFATVGISQAINVMPAPVHEINVEAMDEGSEPIVEEEATVEPVRRGGSDLITILKGQCKAVEYTEWSTCNYNFGTKGFQFRNIVRPTLGNCLPTGIQQAETVRDCQ